MELNKSVTETRFNSTNKKKNKIRRILRENPQGLTPKDIASQSGVNHSTTRSLLKKMLDIKLKNGIRGYYVLIENARYEMFDCKIQNLRLSFSSDKINIKERICETNNLNDVIKFRFEVGVKSKKATMSLGTDYPVDFSCLGLVGYQFQSLVEKYCNIRPELNQIMVNTFEMNKDYFNLALEGCNSIRLDTLLFEYKIYHKDKQYIREEFKSKIPINLTFLNNLMNKGLFYAETNQKIERLSEDINSMRKEIIKLTKIISHFLK